MKSRIEELLIKE